MRSDARNSAPSVLFISTASSIGGMERVVLGLAREFASRGWRTRAFFPDDRRRQPGVSEWCRALGVEVDFHTAVLNAAEPHTFDKMRQFRDLVREIDPDVVNIHYGDNFISIKDVLALRLSGSRRCIVTVHHPTPWSMTSYKKRLLTKLAALLADDLTAVSKASYDVLLQAGVRASRLHLVPNGLPAPRTYDRNEMRRRFNLPVDRTIVGVLARLEPHKGLGDLIDAMSGLDTAVLAIAGEGPERTKLEQKVAERGGSVYFLNRVGDANEFLAACDIFALPSYMEGFGLVYLEAALHGIPSIGTRVGGVPEAVVDGETGILVEPGDIPALTQALERLCADRDLRARLGNAARDRALREFSEKLMADRYGDVFGKRTGGMASPQPARV